MLEDVVMDDFINLDIKEYSNVGSPASDLLPDELILSRATFLSEALTLCFSILLKSSYSFPCADWAHAARFKIFTLHLKKA